eukprot:TRINITY_DN109019_c0_g1_i1.p1 TRINITY_DN109019_c0_g1~~TRINITY_DN109019_c0_g1_i1.p1  ORF type:complete len:238 (+),score=45.09 TRINITY_DN109019_c0_g1_i1:248-961(+)
MGDGKTWLSFNDAINPGVQIPVLGYPEEEETEEIKMALLQPMPLKTQWAFWEQPSTGTYSLNKICVFSTAQEFWSIWNGVPQPSELLENKRFARTGANGQPVFIEALMLFREGIKPEWEDPANAQGGHFQLVVKPGGAGSGGGGQVDEYWNNLVLGMIGETMEQGHHITGIRLVDKISGKTKVTDMIRIELWYHSNITNAECNMLRKSFEDCALQRLDGTKGSPLKADAVQDKKHGK